MARSKVPGGETAAADSPVEDPRPDPPAAQVTVAEEEWPGDWPEELPDGLWPRLLLAQAHGGSISKAGRNAHHSYDYVRAEDVIRDASKILSRAGLVAKVGPEWDIKLTEGATSNGKRTVECQAKSKLTIINPEKPEETVDFPIIGTGTDSPGDKAIYKAQTGGKKYAWQDALTLAFGDDPEDSSSEGAAAAADQRARGGGAPAGPPYGPEIKPQDRGYIRDQAALLLSSGDGPNSAAAVEVLAGLKERHGYVPLVVGKAIDALAQKLRELDPALSESAPISADREPVDDDEAARAEADAASAAAEGGDPDPEAEERPPTEGDDAPEDLPPAPEGKLETDLPEPDMSGLGSKDENDNDVPF